MDGLLVLGQAGWNADVYWTETEGAELECGPVEVGVELFGGRDDLGGRGAVVLEVQPIAQCPGEHIKPIAGRSIQRVGIMGSDGGDGRPTDAWLMSAWFSTSTTTSPARPAI